MYDLHILHTFYNKKPNVIFLSLDKVNTAPYDDCTGGLPDVKIRRDTKMIIVVLMGVCGCGKSTIGRCLADKVGWHFVDADDHHSEKSRHKMARGIPLNDEDRHGWLVSLHEVLKSWQANNQSGVLACSALKRSYREILCTGQTETAQESLQTHRDESEMSTDSTTSVEITPMRNLITFVYLKGTKEVISARMARRDGHFMPVALLDSQFETLEEPSPDEGFTVLTEDIRQPVDVIVSHIASFVQVQEQICT